MGTIIPPWSDFNYCRLKDSWVIKKKPTGGYGETRKGGTEKRSLRGDGETHSRGGRRNAQLGGTEKRTFQNRDRVTYRHTDILAI